MAMWNSSWVLSSFLLVSVASAFTTSQKKNFSLVRSDSIGNLSPLLEVSPLQDEQPSNTAVEEQLEEQAPNLSTTSDPSQWHRDRRRAMLQKYGDQIAPLEQATTTLGGVPLVLSVSASLWGLASTMTNGTPWGVVILLAVFPGSILSLWQLQLLHDLIHGSMLDKKSNKLFGRWDKATVLDFLLVMGSLPCYFGYYLYLKYGHLSHHANLGQHDLRELFESDRVLLEDGDVLFTSHRMHLTGDYGPRIALGDDREFKFSISRSGFYFWQDDAAIRNAILFAISFVYERVLLGINDVVVAALGRNLFFPNKPDTFHDTNARYARIATASRVLLWTCVSFKAVVFLFLCETLWSLPPHPAAAMFVTNHGSKTSDSAECEPTQSTYAGAWYSWLTLGTNFHCEHHDFPTIPLQHLHRLRQIAPEFYPSSQDNTDLYKLLRDTFAHPEFYACMNAGNVLDDAPSTTR